MLSEEAPLLGDIASAESSVAVVAKHNAVYDRFTNSKKKFILSLVSLSGLVPRQLPAQAHPP